MGLLGTVFRERRATEQTFVDNPAQWLVDMFGGRASASGTVVNETTALSSPAVFSSVAGVSETIGSLSRGVYRRLADGGKELDPEHPLYELLHLKPNPEQIAMAFVEMGQASLMLDGNCYAEIVRDGGNRITALWPIHWSRMRVERPGRVLTYVISVPGSSLSAPDQAIRRPQEIRLSADRILHIRAFSLDGVLGLSRIRLMRESLGVTLSLEEFAARFFGNGATLGGWLEHPSRLGEKAHARLKESMETRHQGLSQAHRLAILEEGMKYHEAAVEPDKAQVLQSRQFQVGETGRAFRVPGVMIGHDDKTATYASAEQFFLSYVMHTVRPWTVRWDQSLTVGLLSDQERRTHFIEHNIDSLLRGDALTRAQANEVQLRNGAINPDEWRAMENRNAIPGGEGKKFYVSAQLVPIEKAGAPPDPPPGGSPSDGPDPAMPMDPDPMDEPSRHLLGHLLTDAATRAVHREVEAVRKAAKSEAQDGAAWRTWVEAFYPRHTAYLAEVLHISLDQARRYTEDHRALLLAHGGNVVEEWNGAAVSTLVALAVPPREGATR